MWIFRASKIFILEIADHLILLLTTCSSLKICFKFWKFLLYQLRRLILLINKAMICRKAFAVKWKAAKVFPQLRCFPMYGILFKLKFRQSTKLYTFEIKSQYGTWSKPLWGVSIHWTGLLDWIILLFWPCLFLERSLQLEY